MSNRVRVFIFSCLGLTNWFHGTLSWWHCCFMKALRHGAELEALTKHTTESKHMLYRNVRVCVCACVRRLLQQRRNRPGGSSETTSWWEPPWRTGTKTVTKRSLIRTRQGGWGKVIQTDTIHPAEWTVYTWLWCLQGLWDAETLTCIEQLQPKEDPSHVSVWNWIHSSSPALISLCTKHKG